MSTLSIQDRINFIRGIEIVVPHGHGVVLARGVGQDSADVAAGSGLAFLGGFSAQSKASLVAQLADVINSTLFAQLAANKQCDRWNNASGWLDYYKYVLETVGYVVQSSNVAPLSDANSSKSVDNLVLKLSATFLAGEEYALFTTMSNNKANFQLGVASNNQGDTVLKLGLYYYGIEPSIEIEKALFFVFGSKKVEFNAGNQTTVVLDDEIYNYVREDIIKKLGSQAKDLDMGINLL
ncbi:hypothetical protein K466DRAFT_662581 [Polyporus arcularius HHB13444]|uniref:Uncharacterized protein n=1 Tax=Polyporus arcularius HHB13444 TaxID=1314778 RepID=A0A5C3PGV3_9APHY|nr:hypothetical protein K466DRAFT_662581 [Polyporus arcularius HHB13444]